MFSLVVSFTCYAGKQNDTSFSSAPVPPLLVANARPAQTPLLSLSETLPQPHDAPPPPGESLTFTMPVRHGDSGEMPKAGTGMRLPLRLLSPFRSPLASDKPTKYYYRRDDGGGQAKSAQERTFGMPIGQLCELGDHNLFSLAGVYRVAAWTAERSACWSKMPRRPWDPGRC